MVRDLVRLASGGLTRRRLLQLGGLAGGAAALAACAPPTPPAAGGGGGPQWDALPKDVSGTERTVKFANWTAYLDFDDKTKSYPTLDAFTRRTGIKVGYSEDVDDNDSYFNKVSPQLRARQDIDRDIFVLTDWMATRVVRDRLVQPLEIISMPHASNLRPALRDVSFDPGRLWSLTWQSGMAGLAYDKSKVRPGLRSIEDLWRPDLKGRVVVLSEFRDTAGLLMQHDGVDITGKFTRTDVEKAFDEVTKRVNDGNIRRIKGNSYLEDLKSGNAVAGLVWSGDIFVLRAETGNDNWEFVVPESGGTLWSDNMMIPITSRHRRNAMALMDYYYEPEVAAQVAAYVNYVCPVVGAQQAMTKIDPDLARSPYIFPTDDFLTKHNVQQFRALDAQEDADYSAMWAQVVGN